jgi:peroxiredoxin
MGSFKDLIKRWHKQAPSFKPAGGRFYTPLFFLLAFAGNTHAQGGQPPAPELPVFTFLAANGKTLSKADLPNNKPVLIIFVDVDCDHCQKAVRHMNDSAALFNRLPVYLVSIADEPRLQAFARKYGPRLKAQWLRDPDARNMVRFRPVRYPAMFLYSPEKRLLDYEDNVEAIFRIERNIRTVHGL